ncbi:hypothetical protein PSPO01_16246 [Paraphaeosphaeria sporulosa]
MKKTAVVLRRSNTAWVKKLQCVTQMDHRVKATYYSSLSAVMIFLEPSEYCWIMGDATVKYIE